MAKMIVYHYVGFAKHLDPYLKKWKSNPLWSASKFSKTKTQAK